MQRPSVATNCDERRTLNIVKLLTTLTVMLMASNACGGGTPPGATVAARSSTTLSAASSTLSFGTVNVGTTSVPQNLVVMAHNGSVIVSTITAQSPFHIANVSLPVVVKSGSSLTLQVFFSPTSSGAVKLPSGLTVASNAANSPVTVSLMGTGNSSSGGGGGGGSACVGNGITQAPTNVTTKLSSVAPGVTVTELTTANAIGGSWNSYADIPAYSAPTNTLIYNYAANPAAVASTNLNGTSQQVISGNAQGSNVVVTPDGKLAYYQGENSDGSADLYGVPITQAGTCQQNRLTQRSMRFVAPAAALIISAASYESASGHNVIAYSEGTILHEVLDNGTALPDITLGDPENQDVFHRIRLNPVFPNVMWYKRDAPAPNPSGTALPEIWVVNLESPNTVYSLAGSLAVDHASWSKDGTKLGYIYNGQWNVADVLNSDGSFNLNSSGGFNLNVLGPPSGTFTVNYCNISPDGSVYVCSQANNAVYLMSLDGTKVKFLASPDSTNPPAIFNGIPKPEFLDMQHIVFSSDRTGMPQIYVITGFTTTF